MDAWRARGTRLFLYALLGLLAFASPALAQAPAEESLYAIDVPHLGRMALPGSSPRQAIDRYVKQLVSSRVFPGANKELRAWGDRLSARNATAPTVQALAAGRPISGIELNDLPDLIGDKGHLAGRKLYARGLRRADTVSVFLPPAIARQDVPKHLAAISHLLLVGGDDTHPALNRQRIKGAHRDEINLKRDKRESYLARQAIKRGMPVDSVCRGMQLINRISGGTLHQDIYKDGVTTVPHAGPPGKRFTSLPVKIVPGSGIAHDLGRLSIRSARFMHHQAVDELGRGVKITARTHDGVVAALEAHGGLVRGTQFHPERALRTRTSLAIFRGMADRARAFAAKPARQPAAPRQRLR